MSKKQEYIARIKYENNLPAPSLPPNLLNYKNQENEGADSTQLITSLYSKSNVNSLINLDDDLGMDLDLIKIPGFLNNSDMRFINGFDNIKLHPDDKKLLRDPRVDRLTKTDLSKVSFLRRTEYVSTSITQHSDALGGANSTKKRKLESDDDYERVLNPSEIVEKVESTFDINAAGLKTLKHPMKKKLHAVKTWNLLPDTSSMDQNYFILRLVGSAALDAQEKAKLALQTAMFRPVELEEDDWISMYSTDPKDSKILSEDIEKKIDDISTISENKLYKFKRLRDFDMKQVQTMDSMGNSENTNSSLTDLALVFDDEKKIVYYKPIRSKIELRRRRVNDVIRPLVREHNLDQINITLRNPTTNESRIKDKLRTTFDPIDFPYVEGEEEEEVEENEKNEEQEEGETIEEDPKEERVENNDSIVDTQKNQTKSESNSQSEIVSEDKETAEN